MAGIGFSSTGYNGNFYQSWTLDGKMSLGGVNNGYGDLWLLSSQAVPMVELDNEGLKLWNITDAGYLANGVMYKDGDHTQAIEPREGSYYVDHTERKVYKYEGGYRETQDHEGIMAQMVHKGFGLYEGDIDLKWNGQTGIYFKASEEEGTSDELRIGDFMVVSEDGYGRQIWESSDECTGMSGEPAEWGQYYLWAGLRDRVLYVLRRESGRMGKRLRQNTWSFACERNRSSRFLQSTRSTSYRSRKITSG